MESMSWTNLLSLFPEFTLLLMVGVLLLGSVWIQSEEKKACWGYFMAQFSVLAVLCHLRLSWHGGSQALLSFGYLSDPLSHWIKIGSCLSLFVVFVYSRRYIEDRNMQSCEFYSLALLSLLGMMVLASAQTLLVLYLGLELLSLPLYAMVALRRDNGEASEAAAKYFVLGALASGFLLYGFSMLYGMTGTLELTKLSAAIGHAGGTPKVAVILGLVFAVAGFAFKLGAVPFHMWVPDTYQGAPTPVTLLISTAPKLAAFAMVVRVLPYALPALHAQWQQLWWAISILSLVIGNVVAVVQTQLKRMLAYSSIAHIGYLGLGLAVGTQVSYTASTFYLFAYVLTALAAFGLLTLLSRSGFEIDAISDLKGLNAQHPWLAFLLLLVMFSLAGVPPTVGFIAKFGIIQGLIESHHIGVAVLAMLMAVVGAFYYLRVVRMAYFDEADELNPPVTLQWDERMVISLNALALVAVGLFPAALLQLCRHLF